MYKLYLEQSLFRQQSFPNSFTTYFTLKANMSYEKDPARVAAGLKATLNNPRVSDEAKESAAERLDEYARTGAAPDQGDPSVEAQNITDNQLRMACYFGSNSN